MIFLNLLLLLVPQQDDVTKIVSAISKTYREFKDGEMPFRQKKIITILRDPIESSGRVIWRPKRVLFRTLKPEKSEVLITKEEIKIWIPELRKIEKYDRKQFRLLDSLDIGVGGNVEDMVKHCTARIDTKRARSPEDPESVLLHMTLFDKQISKYIKEMWMWVRKKDHLIFRVEYTDSSGDRTVTEFEVAKIKTNQGLTDKQIELSAPRGTKVVEPMKSDR